MSRKKCLRVESPTFGSGILLFFVNGGQLGARYSFHLTLTAWNEAILVTVKVDNPME